MSNNLAGIIPPLITPFIDDEVSTEKLLENLSKYESHMLSGYVLFGSNGESVFLTREEKLKIVQTVREHTNRTLIVGAGLDSIKETISLSNEAAEFGANYALVLTPSFFQSEMKHRSFLNYYTRVAESVMIPIVIYNVPKFTNVNIEVETIIELSTHPNIIGLKDSTENPSRISELNANVHSGFKLIVGTASVLYSGLLSGASAGNFSFSQCCP